MATVRASVTVRAAVTGLLRVGCMSRGARGRRAVACSARMIVLAASAALPAMVLAAELGINGSRLVGSGAGAGTIEMALIQAYVNNPQLNAQRAATRATDENVPTA